MHALFALGETFTIKWIAELLGEILEGLLFKCHVSLLFLEVSAVLFNPVAFLQIFIKSNPA